MQGSALTGPYENKHGRPPLLSLVVLSLMMYLCHTCECNHVEPKHAMSDCLSSRVSEIVDSGLAPERMFQPQCAGFEASSIWLVNAVALSFAAGSWRCCLSAD